MNEVCRVRTVGVSESVCGGLSYTWENYTATNGYILHWETLAASANQESNNKKRGLTLLDGVQG